MTVEKLRSEFVDFCLQYVGMSNGGKCPSEIANVYNEFIKTNESKFGNYPRKTMMDLSWAWCACTVSFWAIVCGYAMKLMPVELSCCNQIREWMAIGRWIEDDDYIPSPADFIYFDWGGSKTFDSIGCATADHVGIVTSVSNGKIHTVEGNRSGKIMEKVYEIGSYCIAGFGSPDWESIATEESEDLDLEILKRGKRSELVRTAQCLLNMRGSFEPKLATDASFGSKTKAAVEDFQREFGIPITGEIDPKTWNKLLNG